MNPEILCDKLLNEVPRLLSNNNPELGLLYINAVVHMAERGKLPARFIKSLINVLLTLKPWLSTQQQSLGYERLLRLAESQKSTTEIIELNQILSQLRVSPLQAQANVVLKNAFAKPEDYQKNLTSLAALVKARGELEKTNANGMNSLSEDNKKEINKTETRCHFNLLLDYYASQLQDAKHNKHVDVVAVLQRIVALAGRLQKSDLTIEAMNVYQRAFDALSISHSFNETFLLDGLLQLSQANPDLTLPQPLWQQNLHQLTIWREKCKLEVSERYQSSSYASAITQLEQLKADNAHERKEFISDLFKQAESLLGTPPCEYRLYELSAMARDDRSSYSEVEFMVFAEEDAPKNKGARKEFVLLLATKAQGDTARYSDIEAALFVGEDISNNSAAKKYFEVLLLLVKFQIRSLGERFQDNTFSREELATQLLKKSDDSVSATTVTSLIALLLGSEDTVRRAAANTLGQERTYIRAEVNEILNELLHHSDEDIGMAAAQPSQANNSVLPSATSNFWNTSTTASSASTSSSATSSSSSSSSASASTNSGLSSTIAAKK